LIFCRRFRALFPTRMPSSAACSTSPSPRRNGGRREEKSGALFRLSNNNNTGEQIEKWGPQAEKAGHRLARLLLFPFVTHPHVSKKMPNRVLFVSSVASPLPFDKNPPPQALANGRKTESARYFYFCEALPVCSGTAQSSALSRSLASLPPSLLPPLFLT